VNISAKLITIVAVTKTPNASGVRSLAKTIVEIGDINFDAISVIADHFVAVTTCELILFDIVVPSDYVLCHNT